MRTYLDFCGKTSTLIATFVTTTLLIFIVYPNLPIGGEALDVRPGYTHEEALIALESYSERGRKIYIGVSSTIDTLIPVCWVLLFCGLLYRFRLTEGTWYVACTPLIVGFFDLLENLQIIAMLVQYPDIGQTQVAWASTFTMVKMWSGQLILFLALLFLLIALIRSAIAKARGEGKKADT